MVVEHEMQLLVSKRDSYGGRELSGSKEVYTHCSNAGKLRWGYSIYVHRFLHDQCIYVVLRLHHLIQYNTLLASQNVSWIFKISANHQNQYVMYKNIT